jgi:2-polyprenyl-3-methyl-5-hydroxy-6-metoxy-1,4-benzoquinol methylase
MTKTSQASEDPLREPLLPDGCGALGDRTGVSEPRCECCDHRENPRIRNRNCAAAYAYVGQRSVRRSRLLLVHLAGERGPEDEEDDVGFDEIYARAGSDFAAVPWAELVAHPSLVGWLDREPPPSGVPALVVGCGLGDDAEELARRGLGVTAFDVSPTAINWCRKRFPGSAVEYEVADLFGLPDAWRDAFDLVVEIRTLQSLPPWRRAVAVGAIAATVRHGGRVFVRCLARADDDPLGSRPWPVSRRELAAFVDAGLAEVELVERPAESGRGRSLTAVYVRP